MWPTGFALARWCLMEAAIHCVIAGGRAARRRRHQAVGGGLRLLGVCGRAVTAALIAAEHDPKVVARLAPGSRHSKITGWKTLSTASWFEHHHVRLTWMPGRHGLRGVGHQVVDHWASTPVQHLRGIPPTAI